MSIKLATGGGGDKGVESQVTAVDQKKINKFARLNNRLEEIKVEMVRLKNETQNLGDAEDDVLLMDEDTLIGYKFGTTFVGYTSDDMQTRIELTKQNTISDVKRLEEKAEEIQKEMQGLKVELYAKFGTTINLEPEDAE